MSIVAYRGPSTIDGAPIAAVVSCIDTPSRNTKTGDMAQVAFMRADMTPRDAVASGADVSVCGSCPSRPALHDGAGYSCYVQTWRMKAQWAAMARQAVDLAGAVEAVSRLYKPVRFGQYGNASSVPSDVIVQLVAASRRHTLYEAQWQSNAWLAPYAMASVRSAEEARAAQTQGWRTFRQLHDGEELQPGEVMCPNITHGIPCASCLLCDGAGDAKSTAVPNHH